MNKIKITDNFDLLKTMESGQCFRYNILNSSKEDIKIYEIKSGINKIKIYQEKDLLFFNINLEEFMNYWYYYFDLNNNYNNILEEIKIKFPELKEIINFSEGIHFLKQEYIEVYTSFILSQNMNITNIKNNVNRLCSVYGVNDCFPDLNILKNLTVQDFTNLKFGFRDKYLFDSFKNYINKEQLLLLNNSNDMKNKLCEIKGIGNKVANCILLFGVGRRDVFPIDVHIKRIMEKIYFNNTKTNNKDIEIFAKDYFKNYQSYIQQYLFYYCIKNNYK